MTNSLDLTYLNRLRVGLSHFRDHKFRHHFHDSLSPIRDCGKATETTKHYLLHCSNFMYERRSLLQNYPKFHIYERELCNPAFTLRRHKIWLIIPVLCNWLCIINKAVWKSFASVIFIIPNLYSYDLLQIFRLILYVSMELLVGYISLFSFSAFTKPALFYYTTSIFLVLLYMLVPCVYVCTFSIIIIYIKKSTLDHYPKRTLLIWKDVFSIVETEYFKNWRNTDNQILFLLRKSFYPEWYYTNTSENNERVTEWRDHSVHGAGRADIDE